MNLSVARNNNFEVAGYIRKIRSILLLLYFCKYLTGLIELPE